MCDHGTTWPFAFSISALHSHFLESWGTVGLKQTRTTRLNRYIMKTYLLCSLDYEVRTMKDSYLKTNDATIFARLHLYGRSSVWIFAFYHIIF